MATQDGVLYFPLPKGSEPVECEGCMNQFREDEVFDGLCEDCSLLYEESIAEAARSAADEMWLDDQKLRF